MVYLICVSIYFLALQKLGLSKIMGILEEYAEYNQEERWVSVYQVIYALIKMNILVEFYI